MKDAGTQYSPPATKTTSTQRAPASEVAQLRLAASPRVAASAASAAAAAAAAAPTREQGPLAKLGTVPIHQATTTPRSPDQSKSVPHAARVTPSSTLNAGAKRGTPHINSEISSALPFPHPSSTATSPPVQDEQSAKRPRPPTPAVKVMPRYYEHCSAQDLAVLISSMLMELIRYNDTIPLRDGHLTRFHSRAPPTISVLDYLQRLATHATLSSPILLSMVFYIDRLCALYPAFTISSLTVHRFLITAATVASKGLSDSFWTNKTYARVGGVKLKELALLELEFLWRIEWRIVPRPEILADYYRSLIERSDGYVMEGVSGGHDDSSSGGGVVVADDVVDGVDKGGEIIESQPSNNATVREPPQGQHSPHATAAALATSTANQSSSSLSSSHCHLHQILQEDTHGSSHHDPYHHHHHHHHHQEEEEEKKF